MKTRLPGRILAGALLLATALPAATQADDPKLYASGGSADIFEVNPGTGNIANPVAKSGGSSSVFSLATHPDTNQLYLVFHSGDRIGTIDPSTGVITELALFTFNGIQIDWISGITFAPDGTLYGVTGRDTDDIRGDNVGGIAVMIDPATGIVTDPGFATNTDAGGHSLEFNPGDGCLYHFYNDDRGGSGTSFLEKINPQTGAVTPVPLSGDAFDAVNALVYAGNGTFIAYDNNNDTFLEITDAGVVTTLGTVSDSARQHIRGIAFDRYIEPATAVYQPDLRFGKRGNPFNHLGNDVYSQGGNQRLSLSRRPGQTARFYFSIENDGNKEDVLRSGLSGLSKREFRIRCRDDNGEEGNITAKFLAGRFIRPFEPEFVIDVVQVDLRLKNRRGTKPVKAVGRAMVTSVNSPGLTDRNIVKVRFQKSRRRPVEVVKPSGLF